MIDTSITHRCAPPFLTPATSPTPYLPPRTGHLRALSHQTRPHLIAYSIGSTPSFSEADITHPYTLPHLPSCPPLPPRAAQKRDVIRKPGPRVRTQLPDKPKHKPPDDSEVRSPYDAVSQKLPRLLRVAHGTCVRHTQQKSLSRVGSARHVPCKVPHSHATYDAGRPSGIRHHLTRNGAYRPLTPAAQLSTDSYRTLFGRMLGVFAVADDWDRLVRSHDTMDEIFVQSHHSSRAR